MTNYALYDAITKEAHKVKKNSPIELMKAVKMPPKWSMSGWHIRRMALL